MMKAAQESAGQFNVLIDPLFAASSGTEEERLSLSHILASLLLGQPKITGFPSLAAPQRSYWYRFLIRCAAKALHDCGVSASDAAEQDLKLLKAELSNTLAMASGGGDCWFLYQPSPDRPGFLQAPTADGQPPSESYRLESSNLLTAAIGSKNHERKIGTGRTLTAEEAAFALIEYQGGVIFGGRGNYASQLMGSASGKGSGTPFMGARLGIDWSPTFLHDVGVFLERWDVIRTKLGLTGDLWSLWTEPWDGEAKIPASRLDPAFVPFARLVRLGAPSKDGRLCSVWFRPTKAARVEDHTEGGNLGDIFVPLVPKPKQPDEWKVRGTMAGGYEYREVARLLFGEDARPSESVRELQKVDANHLPHVRVVFEGMAFDQGKTEGFHSREVILPATSLNLLADPDPVRLAHGFMLDKVKEAKKALRGACRWLLHGTPKPRSGDEAKVDLSAEALETAVDRNYLDFLIRAGQQEAKGETEYQMEWVVQLSDWARVSFRETMDLIPTPVSQRYEREIRAEAWLNWKLRILREEGGELEDRGVTDDDGGASK